MVGTDALDEPDCKDPGVLIWCCWRVKVRFQLFGFGWRENYLQDLWCQDTRKRCGGSTDAFVKLQEPDFYGISCRVWTVGI